MPSKEIDERDRRDAPSREIGELASVATCTCILRLACLRSEFRKLLFSKRAAVELFPGRSRRQLFLARRPPTAPCSSPRGAGGRGPGAHSYAPWASARDAAPLGLHLQLLHAHHAARSSRARGRPRCAARPPARLPDSGRGTLAWSSSQRLYWHVLAPALSATVALAHCRCHCSCQRAAADVDVSPRRAEGRAPPCGSESWYSST